jgi:hypothetical protein
MDCKQVLVLNHPSVHCCARNNGFFIKREGTEKNLTAAQTLIKEIRKTAYFPKGLFRLKKARGGEVLIYISKKVRNLKHLSD